MEDYIYTSVYEFSWSPDGSQILTAGNDSIINLWNAEDGTLIRSFPLSSLNTGQLKFRWNQEGTQFISYGSDKAQVWNLNNDSPRFEFASEINFRNVYAKWNNNE
ncbi:MAG: hypothetical protein KC449_30740, partial [Anaerolineales bacterium]|nr:hypothetical protein [Anaerolineales bacterium]